MSLQGEMCSHCKSCNESACTSLSISVSFNFSLLSPKRALLANIPFVSLTVDPDEIKRLGKRFRKLDLDNSGSLSIDEFMSLPELQQNPLVQRVIDIFDADGNGEVDFKGKNNSYTGVDVLSCCCTP